MVKDKKNTIIGIDGYGVKKATSIINEIESRKTIIPSVLFASLGIEGLSTKKFKKLLTTMDYMKLIEYALEEEPALFDNIPGFREKTISKLINGIIDNEDLLYFLIDELTILEEPAEVVGKFNVIFTKIRDKGLEIFIEELGGVVQKDINKETNVVVVPDENTESSKTAYAKQHNIPIVVIDNLKDWIIDKYL